MSQLLDHTFLYIPAGTTLTFNDVLTTDYKPQWNQCMLYFKYAPDADSKNKFEQIYLRSNNYELCCYAISGGYSSMYNYNTETWNGGSAWSIYIKQDHYITSKVFAKWLHDNVATGLHDCHYNPNASEATYVYPEKISLSQNQFLLYRGNPSQDTWNGYKEVYYNTPASPWEQNGLSTYYSSATHDYSLSSKWSSTSSQVYDNKIGWYGNNNSQVAREWTISRNLEITDTEFIQWIVKNLITGINIGELHLEEGDIITFNDDPRLIYQGKCAFQFRCDFVDYDRISVSGATINYRQAGTDESVFDDTWTSDTFKSIEVTCDTILTDGDFIEWLTANATIRRPTEEKQVKLSLNSGDAVNLTSRLSLPDLGVAIPLDFASNGTEFDTINVGRSAIKYSADGVVTSVYTDDTWADDAYQMLSVMDATMLDSVAAEWVIDNSVALPGYAYKNVGKADKTYFDITVAPGETIYGFPSYINDPEMLRVFEAEIEAKHVVVFTPTYRVTFLNWDQSLISSDLYVENTILTPDDPIRPPDEIYNYIFTGWDPELAPVTEPATYTATYRAEAKE